MNRSVCVDESFMLFNFLWFCLYCMYFFKGFWGKPQKYRFACERGRTCIFTGYPPPLQLQSGFFCALVLLKHPIKTHCGWLVRKHSVCVWDCLHPLIPCDRWLVTAAVRRLIMKLYGQNHQLRYAFHHTLCLRLVMTEVSVSLQDLNLTSFWRSTTGESVIYQKLIKGCSWHTKGPFWHPELVKQKIFCNWLAALLCLTFQLEFCCKNCLGLNKCSHRMLMGYV